MSACPPAHLADQLPGIAAAVVLPPQMGSIDDNTSGGSYAYRASKAALNIVKKSLSADLAGHNVVCTLLHPG